MPNVETEIERNANAPTPSPSREPGSPGAHPAGVRRVLFLFAAIFASASVPYFVPSLEAHRPYVPGQPTAIHRILDFRIPTRPEHLMGMGRATATRVSEGELLALALGEAAAAVEVAGAERAEDDPNAELRIPPRDLAGPAAEIDDPEGAMRAFYSRLRAAARGEPDALARMAIYSESINGSDWVTSHLRRRLANRFGDGGKGFVPIAPGWASQRHQDVVWERATGFRTQVVNRGQAPDGRFGLGGVLATNRAAKARARFSTTDEGIGANFARFRLMYQAFPDGGDVELSIDDEEPTRISTRAARVEDRVYDLRLPSGAHRVDVASGGGPVRLYGSVFETEGPGVVVDGLMLIGAFARILLNFDESHWQTQLRQRETDLLIFWLGGNDAASRSVGFNSEDFIERYAEAIGNARGGRPEMSCMVMSVLDIAHRERGVVRTSRRVARVVEAQAEVARRTGCAYFNAFEAMGGEGTIWRWYRSRPRLASGDFKHLTYAGSEAVAILLERAILRGYDAFLAEGGE